MKQSYYSNNSRRAVGSDYPWRNSAPSYEESSFCEVIPFPQEPVSPSASWNFSRSDKVFAVALTGVVTTLICLAPAFLSLFA